MWAKPAVFILKGLSYLPFSVLYGLSYVLKVLIFNVAGYRKKVIEENLRKSFPHKTDEEIRAVSRRFQLHFTDVIVETVKCAGISRKQLENRFRFENLELLDRYHSAGKSVITVLGHYGNWEYAGLAYSAAARHLPLLIYRPLSNKTFDRFLFSVRARFGGRLIAEKEAYKELYRLHSKGELTNTALIGDQTPHKGKGIEVPFLNRLTPFFTGAEQLSTRFQYPVVFARIKKVKRGYYTCRFIPVEEHPDSAEKGAITKKHVEELEKSISEQPEFWLWSHRRWKHVRP